MATKTIPKTSDRHGTIPTSLGQYQQLQKAWYAIGDMADLLEVSRREKVGNPCYILRALADQLGEVVTELESRLEGENGHAEVRAQFEAFLSSGYSKQMEAALEEYEGLRRRGTLKDDNDPIWQEIEADIRRADLESQLEEERDN